MIRESTELWLHENFLGYYHLRGSLVSDEKSVRMIFRSKKDRHVVNYFNFIYLGPVVVDADDVDEVIPLAQVAHVPRLSLNVQDFGVSNDFRIEDWDPVMVVHQYWFEKTFVSFREGQTGIFSINHFSGTDRIPDRDDFPLNSSFLTSHCVKISRSF